MFGGTGSGGLQQGLIPYLNDTWLWNGSQLDRGNFPKPSDRAIQPRHGVRFRPQPAGDVRGVKSTVTWALQKTLGYGTAQLDQSKSVAWPVRAIWPHHGLTTQPTSSCHVRGKPARSSPDVRISATPGSGMASEWNASDSTNQSSRASRPRHGVRFRTRQSGRVWGSGAPADSAISAPLRTSMTPGCGTVPTGPRNLRNHAADAKFVRHGLRCRPWSNCSVRRSGSRRRL